MPLSNSQYESILHSYEEKQNRNRHLMEQRTERVYKEVKGYQALDEEIATASVQHGRMLLSGDDDALVRLKSVLRELSSRKRQLLQNSGLPQDYLDPVYDCPDCRDTGYVNGEKCRCFRRQMISILYEQSNIYEMLKHENFDTLSYDYHKGEDLERFRKAVSICKGFIRDFSADYKNLFFYGSVGTGKSFLSGCIARELLENGQSVIYFSAIALFDFLSRYSFDYKNKESLYNAYEDLYNCDLVIIDDLGTEYTNNFVTSQLFSCLNERHIRKKSTIISTNLSLGELRDRYSDRIFSRITSNYEACKLTGQDIRMQKLNAGF